MVKIASVALTSAMVLILQSMIAARQLPPPNPSMEGKFRFGVTAEKAEVGANELVYLVFEIENTSAQEAQFAVTSEGSEFVISVRTPEGKIGVNRAIADYTVGFFGFQNVALSPGQRHRVRLLVNQWYGDFDTPGQYTVQVRAGTTFSLGSELSYVKDAIAVPFLVEVLESAPGANRYGAEGLGRIGDAEAVDALLAKLGQSRSKNDEATKDPGLLLAITQALTAVEKTTTDISLRARIRAAIK